MRVIGLVLPLLVFLAPSAIYAWCHRDDAERAMKGAAILSAGVWTAFFGLFAVGEAFSDPGGWPAFFGTAAWLVPLVVLSLLSWRRPRAAVAILGALLTAVASVYLWSAALPATWATFEDANGPVRAVIALVLGLPIAVVGMRRPRAAGLMLLALSALPLVLVFIGLVRGLGPEGWPLIIVAVPAAFTGVFYLAASRVSTKLGVTRPPQPAPADL